MNEWFTARMSAIQGTRDATWLLIPRLLAGGPLLAISVMHVADPAHFREILNASGFVLPAVMAPLATATELAAGVSLLTGYLCRLGGVLGTATMGPAIYSTLILSDMSQADLPNLISEIPAVPPLPLPIVVLLASIVVVVHGGGRLSLDWVLGRRRCPDAIQSDDLSFDR